MVTISGNCELTISGAEIYYEGSKALEEFVQISENELRINRTAMVTEESSSVLHVMIESNNPCHGIANFKPSMIY